MQFQTTGGNFFNELFGFLTAMEGPRRRPYDAGDSVITIGVGYNLTGGSVALRDATYTELGLKTAARGFTGTDASILAEKAYLARLDAAIAAGPSQIAALDQVMAERAAKAAGDAAFATYIGTVNPRAAFEFSAGSVGLDEMKAVFALGSVSYVAAVNNKLGFTAASTPVGFNDSWEKIALTSLAYNGMGAWPSGLTTAVLSDNRAEAWFQIRYVYNYIGRKYSQGVTLQDKPGTTQDEQGFFDQGIDKGWAKRRYAESQLFGLYDNHGAATLAEAKQTFQMVQRHRSEIFDYETVYGKGQDGVAGSRGDQAAAAASDVNYALVVGTQDLTASLSPAKTTLLADLRASNPDIAAQLNDAQWIATNIYLNGDFGGTLNSVKYETGTFAATGAQDLMIGGTGADTLKGNKGKDLLLGNAGADVLDGGEADDILVGGAGNDALKGGAGNDTYIFNANEGADTIADSDGLGEIKVAGVTLVGAGVDQYQLVNGKSIWTDASGMVYSYQDCGTPTVQLTITGGALGTGVIHVEDFDPARAAGVAGYLGLMLKPCWRTRRASVPDRLRARGRGACGTRPAALQHRGLHANSVATANGLRRSGTATRHVCGFGLLGGENSQGQDVHSMRFAGTKRLGRRTDVVQLHRDNTGGMTCIGDIQPATASIALGIEGAHQ